MPATVINSFSGGQLEQIARVLGETTTGSELYVMLEGARMPVSSESTKWRRLRESFTFAQQRDGNGNAVARFITVALDPARFVHSPDAYDEYRVDVNKVLSFSGIHLDDGGQLVPIRKARTIPDAEERADRLRSKLKARDVHPDVLAFCRAELVTDNYFHAVLEASKSVAEKIRVRTGLTGDGAELAQAAFTTATNMPPLAFNGINDPTEVSEHRGLALMVQGLFMTFRNTTAHAPKISWAVDEATALDMLATASMLHRRIDDATVTPAAPAYAL